MRFPVCVLVLVAFHLRFCPASCHTHSGLTFDPESGGYHDVAVILSPELDKSECPQILENVKVRSRLFKYFK